MPECKKKQKNLFFNKVLEWLERLHNPVQLFVLVGTVLVAIWLFFRYEKLQNDLSLVKLRTETEIADVQLSKSKTTRFKVDSKLKVWELEKNETGMDRFEAALLIGVKNISDKSFSIPSYLVEYYIGTVDWKDIGINNIKRMNLPAEKISESAEDANWKNNKPSKDVNEKDRKSSEIVNWKISGCEFYRENDDIDPPQRTTCKSVNTLTSAQFELVLLDLSLQKSRR